MKRIEKEISINIGTLKSYGKYGDKIMLPELDAYISLTVKIEPENNTEGKVLGVGVIN
jgi:hypothetical protein